VCPDVKKNSQHEKFWLRLWIACARPQSGEVFKVKENSKRQLRSSLRQVHLNTLDGLSDRKSWFNVINSSKCVPSTVSIIQINDFLAHFARAFSKFNQSLQSVFSFSINITILQVPQQAHTLSISGGDIYRALKTVKKSRVPDMDGMFYNHLAFKCLLLSIHIQLLFHMCLARSLVLDSFLSES